MVLIIVLPLLSLLAILGSAFVALAHLELQTAASYVDRVRARAMAVSGVEYAIARLKAQAMRQAHDSPVWDAPGGLNQWVFRNTANSAVGAGTPLVDPATGVTHNNPSYLAGTTGYGHTYSGRVGGSYVADGDYFVLKIIDCASKLNINSPHQTNGAQPNFAAMMDTLIQEIKNDYPAAAAGPAAFPATLTGANILTLRTNLGGRFAAIGELASPPVSLNENAMTLFADFVTATGWVDDDVVEPNPAAPFPPGDNNVNLTSRTRTTTAAYPGRFPVNLNTAPRPVLVAVMSGVAGNRLRPRSYMPSGQFVLSEPSIFMDKEAIPAITTVQARSVADAIIAQREATPFKSWTEFENFMVGRIGNAAQEKLLVVNADPNTRTAKFNPNLGAATRHNTPAYNRTTVQSNSYTADVDFMIDKFDLNPGTTEFCFSSMGYYDIESIGRVMGQDRSGTIQVFAHARILASVRVYDIWRHTTQQEFSSNQVTPIANPTVYTYPEALWDTVAASGSGNIGTGGSFLDGSLQLSPEWESSAGATWYINNRRAMNLINPAVPGGYLVPNTVATGPAVPTPHKYESYGDAATGPKSGTGASPTAADSLWKGADLANDGILCWSRGNGATINGQGGAQGEHLIYDPYQVLGTLPSDPTTVTGTLEFWIKPASTHGSNEVYLAMVTATTSDNRQGLAWRLERYGTRLYSIRSYWFFVPGGKSDVYWNDRAPYPDDWQTDNHTGMAVSDCIGYTYYQQSIDISSWRAGEWHKIQHVWPHTTAAVGAHGIVSHMTTVDNVPMGTDIPWVRDKDHPNIEARTDSGTIVGDPGWESMTTITYSLTRSTNNSNIMHLQSLDNWDRLYLGGYLYTKGSKRLYQIDADLQNTSNRFTNATIDEVRYFRNNTAPGTSWNRYSAAGGTFEGKMPGMPGGGVLGTVSYSVRYPTRWNGANQAEGTVTLSYSTDVAPAWVPGSGTKYGEGSAIYAASPANRKTGAGPLEFRYQLTFTPAGTPTVLSPVVDDVTVTLVRPQVITWVESAEF